MKIENARIEDAKELTDLTIRSKSYWNYSDQQIEIWRNDLTVTADYILEKEVFKLVMENKIIGYYSYFKQQGSDFKLENLFIEPTAMSKGFGKRLMVDFFKRILKNEFNKVVLDADPNAEKFYAKLGFNVVGKMETSIKNRYLPIMEMSRNSVKRYIEMS